MKKTIFNYAMLLCLVLSCKKHTEAKTLYNKDFKWTITIPEDFTNVDSSESKRMENQGIDAIEDTYDTEVINQAKTIFVFKNAKLNYLESNYQPFDTNIDGDYLESCKEINEVLYETFKAQIPNVAIDSTSSVEPISGLDFQTFKMKVNYPNGMTMHSLMYSRLFDKKEFSVNIMYVDDKQGEKMINAWTNSKFE